MPDGLFTASPDAVVALMCMALATYVCRAGGVWLMAHVPITPRMRRALAALPGSIMVSTVIPIGFKTGPAAVAALVVAVLVMMKWRKDLAALIAGLLTISLLRALGF